MHNPGLDKNRVFADRRQPLSRAAAEALCGHTVQPAMDAVHGSQIENILLFGMAGRAIEAPVAAYTPIDSLSFAAPERVPSRRAGKPRSTPDPLLLASV